MITTRLATSADYAAIAALAAARGADPASFWSAMPAMDAARVAALAGAGWIFHVSTAGSGAATGFAMTARLGNRVSVRVAAATSADFYRLMAGAAAYWLAAGGVTMATTYIPAAALNERGWLDALAVVKYGPFASSAGVPALLAAVCDLAILQTACAAKG